MQVLIAKAQKGDKQAFAELYDLYADRIFRYIKIKVTDQQNAEDLLQETFLKSWRFLDQFSEPANFQAWLYRIATNCVNDYFRKVYRRPMTVELNEKIDIGSTENINDEMQLKFETEQAREAFKLLPTIYAQVLELRFIREFSVEEVSKILKKSNVAVRLIQHRALKKLRDILTKEHELQYSKI